MTGIKQKYQDLFFQTEQTVNRKKSGFRAARNSMQNLLSYCGLVDAKIRASDIGRFTCTMQSAKQCLKTNMCNRIISYNYLVKMQKSTSVRISTH
jgi:hypothetical protein